MILPPLVFPGQHNGNIRVIKLIEFGNGYLLGSDLNKTFKELSFVQMIILFFKTMMAYSIFLPSVEQHTLSNE